MHRPSRALHPARILTSSRAALAITLALLAGSVAAYLWLTTRADAAGGAGSQTVGSTPIALTQPSDNLLGRMTPSADASTKGMYAPQVGWPVIPVNAILAPNGHLITYGTPLNTAVQGGRVYDDWDPAFGTIPEAHVQTDGMASYDSFCNGLVFLPDGRTLMVGGNGANGSSDQTMYFNPLTHDETMGPGLNRQRWYATALRLTDDRVLVVGGGNYYSYNAFQNPNDNSIVSMTPEIGDGSGAWSLLNGATSSTAFGALNNRWWYPRAYNAPDGSVFGISGDQLWRMSTSGNGTIQIVGTLPTSMGVSGSSVMYAPGRILVAGGNEVANGTTTIATNAAETIDINGGTPVVTTIPSMASRRQWLNLTVLPTGDVFANGGTVRGTDGGADNSSYTAELWNPTTQQWRTAATAQRIRTYHSTSVLMPSGAVFTGGGGVPGPEDNFNSEMYYPPSLFTKDASGNTVWASRPTITSIAGSLTWGGNITLGTGDARRIASVSLINAGSVTHSQNTDERRIPLTFTQNGASLSVSLPTSVNTVPPGTYLLSAVDANGVPSPSQLVTFKRNAAGVVNVFEADYSRGRVGPTGTVVPGVVPLKVGNTVSFEAVDDPTVRIRSNGTSIITDTFGPATSDANRMASSFVVRNGLANGGISLESAAQPGQFLALQSDGSVALQGNNGSSGFAANATWSAQSGLQGNYTSLTNVAKPTLFLRKLNGRLVAQATDNSDQFRADATFSVRPALGPAAEWAYVNNTNSGLPLSLQNGGLTAGTSVIQDTASTAPSREWEIRPTDDGHYKIVNAASGFVLGIKNADNAAGAAALVWNDNGTADHLWDIYPQSGHWMIRNVNSGLLLGVTNMSKAAGTQVLQWNDNGTADHFWDLASQGPVATPGIYRVTSANSGLNLDTQRQSTARGATVVQATASTSASQRWTLVDAGNGQFKVRNGATGFLLGITNMSQNNGTTALVWDDNGTADHLWRVVNQGGRWILINVNSNQDLGIWLADKRSGATAVQWPYNGAADHYWTLSAN